MELNICIDSKELVFTVEMKVFQLMREIQMKHS